MEIILANIEGGMVSSNAREAFSLYSKSHFGEPSSGKIHYTPSECLFLVEKGKIEVFSGRKKLTGKNLLELFRKKDKKIDVKYIVFRDLREKGYTVKAGLKFGAEFRVYEKGSSQKSSHSKWIVFTDRESRKISWNEFSARNRVAHSTKKKLLVAVVDEENDITYYEINWIRT